ncbi:MAG: 50S ribosomal protein L21 [Legionellales bacterium]|nr:50S ribosomal protein L21 [Legionellales bacterium]|tara:strand:- start:4710 stop:5021 length:312 start_codon:yes stop_codon:yes gene_type:complete
MYAVIKSGGKQYKVSKGQTLRLEKLPEEVGKAIEIEEVLMVHDGKSHQFGTPYVKGAKVLAEVTEHGRGKKIDVVKFKRRKQYLKRQGHRQDYTAVTITDIKA